jgi:hypothetical protein
MLGQYCQVIRRDDQRDGESDDRVADAEPERDDDPRNDHGE